MTHGFAALHSEGPVLTQLVVQVVEVKAEGGRSAFERHVEVRPQLRHVQGLWLPDCRQTKVTITVFNTYAQFYLCILPAVMSQMFRNLLLITINSGQT